MLTNLEQEIKDFKFYGFFQPLIEAITNSLQSNAKVIKINFTLESKELDGKQKINGFTIEDNGDGFTKNNIDRFIKLKSKDEDNEDKKGCKGIGRLSYLKVFKKTYYTSYSNDGKEIKFNFTDKFSHTDIKPIDYSGSEKKTIATFSDLTDSIIKYDERGNIKKDNRVYYNVGEIKQEIINHLLPMLYFKKKQNQTFEIIIDDDIIINLSDINDFKECEPFELIDKEQNKYIFTLLYSILDINHEKGIIHDFYCANERTVCTFKSKELFINEIKNKNFSFLLVSDFFDAENIVDNERNDFVVKPKERTLFCPFNWNEDINPRLREKVIEVMNKEIKDFSKEQEKHKTEIIKKRPYLAKYILNNDAIGILDLQEEIKNAQRQFNSDRDECLELIDGEQILDTKQKDKLGETIHLTFAEYMWLRHEILKEIQNLVKDREKNEAKIHNLILPKGKKLDENTMLIENLYHNNLWLIDDRFMSYRYAFSEEYIKKLKVKILDKKKTKEDNNRFDFAILFDNTVNEKHCITIELKPFDLNEEKNKKGETQIVDYQIALSESNRIVENWYYLITEVDDRMEKYLIIRGYKKFFSSSGSIFVDNSGEGRRVIMNITTLINECEKRHKLFFDIL